MARRGRSWRFGRESFGIDRTTRKEFRAVNGEFLAGRPSDTPAECSVSVMKTAPEEILQTETSMHVPDSLQEFGWKFTASLRDSSPSEPPQWNTQPAGLRRPVSTVTALFCDMHRLLPGRNAWGNNRPRVKRGFPVRPIISRQATPAESTHEPR